MTSKQGGRRDGDRNDVDHLRDLVTALRLRADKSRIGRYRELLRAKAATTTK